MTKMKNQISVFIMDINNSSVDEKTGEELSNYLSEVVLLIEKWTDGIVTTQVKHRMGDEIILISENYSTAYTIAFYLSRIWKFKNNKPYFGLTFGDIEKNLVDVDVEGWIHPLVKNSRNANEALKNELVNRYQFNFELISKQDQLKDKSFMYEFESLINTLLSLQENYIFQQTKLQDLICTLHLIFMQQKKIASFLNRTAATISNHYKKGNCEEILNTFEQIQKVLISIQDKKLINGVERSTLTINEKLNQRIKKYLNEHIHDFFENEIIVKELKGR
jgi:hypothetical protein